jgi:hypothetical protein
MLHLYDWHPRGSSLAVADAPAAIGMTEGWDRRDRRHRATSPTGAVSNQHSALSQRKGEIFLRKVLKINCISRKKEQYSNWQMAISNWQMVPDCPGSRGRFFENLKAASSYWLLATS